MAKKMLGKVVAGAALGGASLLVFAPGVAFADGPPPETEGKVFAKPHAAKPGEEIKLVEICEKPQEKPFVWSKVTGKVKLESARDGGKWGRGDSNGKDWQHGKDRGDWKPGGDHGDWKPGDDKGDWKPGGDKGDWTPGEDKGDWTPGGDKGDWTPGGDKGDRTPGGDKGDWTPGGDKGDRTPGEDKGDWTPGEDKGDWTPGGDKGEWQDREEAPQQGAGGGAAADEEGNWKSDEHGQDAEGARDRKDRDEHGADKGDRWEHEKDFVYYGEARIAEDAKPGTYKLEGSCGEGELVVLPHGGVDGGDGGLTAGTDRDMATAGAGLVGAAALGGLVLLRRRRTDEFAA
ncbi:hypothetical protein [Micromonospora sp. DT229]|uniref:hypothetical protein n=1 Tax=Micromonospora sp. DT229 TaxID=3393430 RepID=UPI003CEC1CB5